MAGGVGSRLSPRKWILVPAAVCVLVAAWWFFRPEKLWINTKVNEADPLVAGAAPQPLYTGQFEGKDHQTRGRASLYKSAEGKQFLRLTDFVTSDGPDIHVLLGSKDDSNLGTSLVKDQLDGVDLGPLKGTTGGQDYDLPQSIDPQRYDAVVIYCQRLHTILGVAKLERF